MNMAKRISYYKLEFELNFETMWKWKGAKNRGGWGGERGEGIGIGIEGGKIFFLLI